MSTDLPSSQDVFIQASVTFLVDHLEATGKMPAELEAEIDWNPELHHQRSLAEWIRGEEKDVEECLWVISAVCASRRASPPPGDRETGPVYLPKDAGTSLYGSRPAEGYQPTVTSFVHEVSEESLDAFGQKLRLLYLVVQNLFGDPTQRTPKEGKTLVHTLKSYFDVAKQVFGIS